MDFTRTEGHYFAVLFVLISAAGYLRHKVLILGFCQSQKQLSVSNICNTVMVEGLRIKRGF